MLIGQLQANCAAAEHLGGQPLIGAANGPAVMVAVKETAQVQAAGIVVIPDPLRCLWCKLVAVEREAVFKYIMGAGKYEITTTSSIYQRWGGLCF